LTELGKGVFTIKLGKLTLDSEVIIAEIEDDALLGLDILTNFGLGVFTISSVAKILC
jgi:hypothetical protein